MSAHDSETIDFTGAIHRPQPPADRTRDSRRDLTAVMGRLDQLYARLVPLLKRATPDEAEAVAAALVELHDTLGRTKIGLLPRSY
jgi:hypothetical protein